MSGDNHYSNVSVLLSMDNDALSDSSLNALTVTKLGSVARSATQVKFGNSAVFNGTNAALSLANTTLLTLPADFTIEAWIYLTGGAGTFRMVYDDETSGVYGLLFQMTSANVLSLTYMPDNAADKSNPANLVTITGTTPINTGQWYHVAVTRSGSSAKLFVNGGVDASGTMSVGIHNAGSIKYIGRRADATRFFSGYIDDFRITKGVARYTGAFTPPIEALPAYRYAVSGTIVETLPVTDWTVRAYRADTGALLGETNATGSSYEAGTGLYLGPTFVTISPRLGARWSAGMTALVGDYCYPTNLGSAPRIFKCSAITTGVAGGSEPTWPSVDGNSVTDGGITWIKVSDLVQPVTHGPLIPS